MQHPRLILLGPQAGVAGLPVCDHYSGVEARMRKSLALQEELRQEFGACVVDVTLDCEDGAAAGAEVDHALLLIELIRSAPPGARIAVRSHAVGHPAFEAEMNLLLPAVGQRLCHWMLPKLESLGEVEVAAALAASHGLEKLPLHGLIESPGAVHRAFDLAGHPRIQSLSFGLMDFVSAHGGAIPASAMGAEGQFRHPLVLRAKLDIASACHAQGKVPAHGVVTEFSNADALAQAVRVASQDLGYTRMWSIHPAQIRTIVAGFAPEPQAVELACELLLAAARADWAPIAHRGQLHDRASYRFFWQVLERAHRTGRALPAEAAAWFHADASVPLEACGG